MAIHFLQSEIWEKYQHREGKATFRLASDTYDCLVLLEKTPVLSYLYAPYGPGLKIDQKIGETPDETAERAFQDALGELKRLASAENASFIRIEPAAPFSAARIAEMAKEIGAISKKSKDLDPANTWVLDLENASEEDLLKNMESRKVRYWRNHENKGMKIRASKDPEEITILTNFLKTLGETDNFIPQDEAHLKNQLKSGFATLYVVDYVENSKNDLETENPAENASKEAVPIAAALVYDHAGVRYYAHAATDTEHRKFAAGSILLIQMILDAKRSDAKIFDFWGITTSTDPKHPWYGFTQYKKSFGGHEVDFAGTYDLILNTKKYKLYSSLRQLNRKLRKASR